ncbi:MAG: hypothetical protein H3C31_01520 [Brumimicrobium sp.]|nr:hypothetical protein [Brumimicrobium sp.]MCO5269406.1 hypothetical protein [Brumimicrobium sp.]
MKKQTIITWIFLGLFTLTFYAQEEQTPINYFGFSEPILLSNTLYELAFSSHPRANYYKQEYIKKGESLSHFDRLITLDVLVGGYPPEYGMGGKIIELKKLQESNPRVQYEVLEQNGDLILDFIIVSDSFNETSEKVAERNVYMYRSIMLEDNVKALVLFAVSDRAYGDEAEKFYTANMAFKFELVNTVAGFKLPKITITN